MIFVEERINFCFCNFCRILYTSTDECTLIPKSTYSKCFLYLLPESIVSLTPIDFVLNPNRLYLFFRIDRVIFLPWDRSIGELLLEELHDPVHFPPEGGVVDLKPFCYDPRKNWIRIQRERERE